MFYRQLRLLNGSTNDTRWVPAPKDELSLYIRTYWPKAEILAGK